MSEYILKLLTGGKIKYGNNEVDLSEFQLSMSDNFGKFINENPNNISNKNISKLVKQYDNFMRDLQQGTITGFNADGSVSVSDMSKLTLDISDKGLGRTMIWFADLVAKNIQHTLPTLKKESKSFNTNTLKKSFIDYFYGGDINGDIETWYDRDKIVNNERNTTNRTKDLLTWLKSIDLNLYTDASTSLGNMSGVKSRMNALITALLDGKLDNNDYASALRLGFNLKALMDSHLPVVEEKDSGSAEEQYIPLSESTEDQEYTILGLPEITDQQLLTQDTDSHAVPEVIQGEDGNLYTKIAKARIYNDGEHYYALSKDGNTWYYNTESGKWDIPRTSVIQEESYTKPQYINIKGLGKQKLLTDRRGVLYYTKILPDGRTRAYYLTDKINIWAPDTNYEKALSKVTKDINILKEKNKTVAEGALSASDALRLGTLLTDIVSLSGGPVGIASSAAGIGLDLAADISDPSVTAGETMLHSAANTMWTGLSAVPGLKALRLTKKARVLAPLMFTAAGWYGMANDPNLKSAIGKLKEGDFGGLTKAEVSSINYLGRTIIGSIGSGKSMTRYHKLKNAVRRDVNEVKSTYTPTIKVITNKDTEVYLTLAQEKQLANAIKQGNKQEANSILSQGKDIKGKTITLLDNETIPQIDTMDEHPGVISKLKKVKIEGEHSTMPKSLYPRVLAIYEDITNKSKNRHGIPKLLDFIDNTYGYKWEISKFLNNKLQATESKGMYKKLKDWYTGEADEQLYQQKRKRQPANAQQLNTGQPANAQLLKKKQPHKYQEGGTVTTQTSLSSVPTVSSTSYATTYNTSNLTNPIVGSSNSSPWSSAITGNNTGRYVKTPNITTSLVKQAENSSYYGNFTKDLFNANGDLTDVGKSWAKSVDQYLPENSRIYDSSGNLRSSWTVKGLGYKSSTHGGPKTYTNVKDYITSLRSDNVPGAMHNIFSKEGTRYYYNDSSGNLVWVSPESASSFSLAPAVNTVDTANNTVWHDILLSEPSSSAGQATETINTGLMTPAKITAPTETLSGKIPSSLPSSAGSNSGLVKGMPMLGSMGNIGAVGGYAKAAQAITSAIGTGLLRLAYDLHHTQVNLKEYLRDIRPPHLETYHIYRPIHGDEAIKAYYNNQANDMITRVLKNPTSDSRQNTAALMAAIQAGNELRTRGNLANNAEIRRTSELSREAAEGNIARDTENANVNNRLFTEFLNNVAAVKAAVRKGNAQSVDNYLKLLEINRLNQLQAEKARLQALRVYNALKKLNYNWAGDKALLNLLLRYSEASDDAEKNKLLNEINSYKFNVQLRNQDSYIRELLELPDSSKNMYTWDTVTLEDKAAHQNAFI